MDHNIILTSSLEDERGRLDKRLLVSQICFISKVRCVDFGLASV